MNLRLGSFSISARGKGRALAQQAQHLERRQLLGRIVDRRERLVEDGDLDAALLQPVPIGHAHGYLLIIVEQGELDAFAAWRFLGENG